MRRFPYVTPETSVISFIKDPPSRDFLILLIAQSMALNIDPAVATFPATGGNATHKIISQVDARHAFKVKSSNNDHYRVRPVYGFIDGKGQVDLEISRSTGPAKEDKLVIQWAEVPAQETDAQAPFKAGAQSGEVILPMKAE